MRSGGHKNRGHLVASVGQGEKLNVEQGFLDTYFGIGKDQINRDFLELFEEPEKKGDDGSDIFRPDALRAELVAKNAGEVIEFMASRSRDGDRLRRTMRDVYCPKAGIRTLISDDWPFLVAHIWFRIETKEEHGDRPPAIDSYVLAGLQNIFYPLREVLGAETDDIPSAAVFSILAGAETSFFSQIREAWHKTARAGEDAVRTADDGLWKLLPDNWKIGNNLTANHMAMGINLHALVGGMYATENPKQLFSITVQDEARTSYGDDPLEPGFGGWSGSADFLSPRRGAYYSPRSQELGMLMLLNQWTVGQAKTMGPLELDIFDRLSRTYRDNKLWYKLTKSFHCSPRKLKKERLKVRKMQSVLRRAVTGATAQLRYLVSGKSIYSGVEVPAYHYPDLRHGSQGSVQEGLVQGLAERTDLRIRGLTESTSTLSQALAEEISLTNSVRQTVLAGVMVALTAGVLALTYAVAGDEIQPWIEWIWDRLAGLGVSV